MLVSGECCRWAWVRACFASLEVHAFNETVRDGINVADFAIRKDIATKAFHVSHIAHCSSRGVLVHKVDNVIQIKSDRLIDPIIVYSSRSALWVTANWSEHFALIPNAILEKLRDDVDRLLWPGVLTFTNRMS
jgi:hypothetical protein